MKSGKLSTQYFLKITEVFKKNTWTIVSGEEENSLFNRYCERMLAIGENKKKDLMLELTERYLWIPTEDYSGNLIAALIKLFSMKTEISETTKIYVMQLISPEDIGKVKSSSMLLYSFNDVKFRYDTNLSKYKFEVANDISQISTYLSTTDSILILVDDYIGTGETAEKSIIHMLNNKVDINKIAIVSLVAQEQGINYLQKYGICVAANIVRKRGISDFCTGEALRNKIKLMKEIENKMAVKEKYSLGYGNSEALVTMCRTPNNTFPLFWAEKGNMPIAPFPRD